MLRLKAVAVVLFAVEGFAGIGGQLLRPVDIVQVVLLQGVGKAARVFPLQLLAVHVCDAADDEGIAPPGGKVPQQVDGRAQGPCPDGENEGGLALVAELGEHPVPHPGNELAVALVPDVDVAEVVVRAGAVLSQDQRVHPAFVTEGDGFEDNGRLCHGA